MGRKGIDKIGSDTVKNIMGGVVEKAITKKEIAPDIENEDEVIETKVYKPKKVYIEKLRRTYCLETDIIDKLEEFCTNKGVDRSEIVSEALKEFLTKYK